MATYFAGTAVGKQVISYNADETAKWYTPSAGKFGILSKITYALNFGCRNPVSKTIQKYTRAR